MPDRSFTYRLRSLCGAHPGVGNAVQSALMCSRAKPTNGKPLCGPVSESATRILLQILDGIDRRRKTTGLRSPVNSNPGEERSGAFALQLLHSLDVSSCLLARKHFKGFVGVLPKGQTPKHYLQLPKPSIL